MAAFEAAFRSASEPTDEDAVRCVVAGDLAMFEILMQRHHQRVYRTVRAILGFEDEVEDVVQQAYINAYLHLDQFAGESRFLTWLTRIAVNEALLRRRRRDRLPHFERDEFAIGRLMSKASDPFQVAAAGELRELLKRELTALPTSFRDVVVLRDVEELSTAETAKYLGISEDLVKTRLHRGHAMMRGRLSRRRSQPMQRRCSLSASGAVISWWTAPRISTRTILND